MGNPILYRPDKNSTIKIDRNGLRVRSIHQTKSLEQHLFVRAMRTENYPNITQDHYWKTIFDSLDETTQRALIPLNQR
jgi:hypothetical protein